jgi:hypothetical protein
MKIRKKTEPDLYVVNRPFTKAEKEELSLIIATYKKTHELIYPDIKPAAATKKPKKYEVVEADMVFTREPEPDLFVVNKPFTKAGKKELSKIIEDDKKKHKLKYPKGLQGKNNSHTLK